MTRDELIEHLAAKMLGSVNAPEQAIYRIAREMVEQIEAQGWGPLYEAWHEARTAAINSLSPERGDMISRTEAADNIRALKREGKVGEGYGARLQSRCFSRLLFGVQSFSPSGDAFYRGQLPPALGVY